MKFLKKGGRTRRQGLAFKKPLRGGGYGKGDLKGIRKTMKKENVDAARNREHNFPRRRENVGTKPQRKKKGACPEKLEGKGWGKGVNLPGVLIGRPFGDGRKTKAWTGGKRAGREGIKRS